MKKIYLLLILSFCFTLQSMAQITIDPKGTKITVDSSKWKFSGVNIYNKNTGNVGIGNTNPTYKLDVTGKLRVSDSLIANSAQITSLLSGSTSDSVVVANPTTGLLKRINASSLSALAMKYTDTAAMLLPYMRDADTTGMLANYINAANNGLTKSGKTVQLGGNLTTPTTITNNSNTLTIATGGTALNITGLTSGAATDSLLTINTSTGKINRVASSILNKNDSTTASNGLNLVGKDVRLGGALTGATSITTTGTNTLSLTGLTSGSIATDSIMVATAAGVVKQVSANQLNKIDSTTANNGLTLTGKNVQLGGNLTTGTTITNNTNTLTFATGGSALNITGLTAGATTDSVLTINASTGLVKRINASSLSALAMKYTDTTAMLTPYMHYSDTTAMLNNYINAANNGLTKTGKTVQLGGNLTTGTTITNNTNTLTFATGGSALNITGLTAGATTDSILTINASTGRVNRITSSVLNKNDSTTASNGLNLVGKDVKLGGALTSATSIATTGTNTLALTGLTSGSIATDSLMVATAAGVVKQVSANQFNKADSTTASNGLTLAGKDVRLGGALTGATSITTTGTNTLAVSGLQSGSTNDSVVVADATSGVLRRLSTSNFAGWLLSGNSGTNPANNFIGTKDNVDLVFRINNIESGRLNLYNLSASFGYNSSAAYKSTVMGYGATTSSSEAVAIGNSATAAYQAVTVGSAASTTSNSSVAVGNAATATYQSTAIGANTSATGNNSTVIGFGATTSQANSLILGGSGIKVGIGTSTPSYALDVNSGSNPLKLTGVVSGASTDSVLTINSSGVVRNVNFNSFTSGNVKYTDTAAMLIPYMRDADTTGMLTNYANDASNGLTKSGKTIKLGGALTGATTITTSGTNTLSITGLTSGSVATDSVMVATSAGVVKQVSISQLNKKDSTTASNGLTLLNKDVQLGGALTKKDTITTTATNTLAIAGLQSGSITTDSILTVNGTTNAIARIAISQINPISGLLPATKINTIDNLNWAQTWNWSTANTQTPLALNGNALTTGSLLSLATSSNTLTSGSLLNVSGQVAATTTKGLLNVNNTAASTTGTVATIQSNSTAGSGVTILANGNVGIGNAAPASVTSTTNNTPTTASTNTLAVNGTVDAPIYTSPVQALGSKGAGSFTWDLSLGANASVTLTGNATLAFSNQKKGMYGLIIVTQDATGSRTLTLPTGSKVINGGGGVATLTTTASASDILTFYYDGANYWWTIGNNYN